MSNYVLDITSKEEFDNIVATEDRPIVVDLWATWCMPCKMQAPILHQFADDMAGKVCVLKVNVDECEELAALLGVQAIPTILVIKDGDLKEKHVGLCSDKDLSSLVIKYL
ncbi:MAG: thioredoxin [Clostridia bacterium]|nr:thioredoxin [Clostridia bacterium]